MDLPKPLLWLPKSYVEREQQRMTQRQPETFFQVALGYEEVFGTKPSWSELAGRLHQYSLAQVLGALGRVSGVLDHFQQRHAEAQKWICDGLLGERSPQVWRAVLEWLTQEKRDGAPESTPVLFHERQLINLAKVAFLELD